MVMSLIKPMQLLKISLHSWILTNKRVFSGFFLQLNDLHDSLITLCKCLSDPLTSENKCSMSLIICIFSTWYIFLRKSNPMCQDEWYPRAKHIAKFISTLQICYLWEQSSSEWLVIILPSFDTWAPSCGFVNQCVIL